MPTGSAACETTGAPPSVMRWRRSAEVDAEVASSPFSIDNTEAFAATARSRIPPDEEVAPSANSSSASDDYAAGVRARATPPPPPK